MAIPRASAAAISRSLRYWDEFVAAFQVTVICGWAVAAYMLLRAAPPVDLVLPEWSKQTVSPVTASGEAGALKRHLRDLAMSRSLDDRESSLLTALGSDIVRRIRRSLGATIRRTKTKKLPILWHMVREALSAVCSGLLSALSTESLRDFAIVAVGLAAGLRRSEIVALRAEHLCPSARGGFLLVVMEDKTNRCAGPHTEPKTVPIEQPLAVEIIRLYVARFKDVLVPGSMLFFNLSHGRGHGAALAPGTINSIIRRLFPGAGVVAHSLRVGFASELRAAGTSIELIMEMGRWTSLRALLYILPSIELMSAASQAMGSGNITFSSLALVDQLRKQALAVRQAAVPVPAPALLPVAARGAGPAAAARPPSPSCSPPCRLPVSLSDDVSLRISRVASRPPSLERKACWRCSTMLGPDKGWLCDFDDDDGKPCTNCLCDECWPHGLSASLFCRDHRRGRRPPRGRATWSSDSSPSPPPARCDGTNAGDRLRRIRDRARREDEADLERDTRRRLFGRDTGGGAAAAAAAPAPNLSSAGDTGDR